MRSPLVIGTLGAALQIAAAQQPAPWATPCPDGRAPALWALLDEATESAVREFPLWSGPTLGDDRYNDRLQDASPEAVARRLDESRDLLARLEALDRTGFSDADRLDADLLAHDLQLGIDGARYHPEQTPVTAQAGPQYWLPQMASFAPFSKPRHDDDYVARLGQVSRLIDQQVAQMRAGMRAGRVPPRVVVEPAIDQARTLAETDDPAESPYYAPFASRDPDDRQAALARSIIELDITPAYARLADFLENEYLPACRDSIGAADSIDGPAAYDFALRTHTTLDMDAEQVHAVGLREVERIRAEMLETIARTDWHGNLKQWPDDDALLHGFFAYLRTDPRFYFTEPADLLAGYRDIAKRIDAELPGLFGRLPRLPYGVRPIPDYAAPSSPSAYYYQGSMAGAKPGYFMANTYRLDQRPIYEMTALTLHEAVPGHHLQIALAQELEDVHPYRRLAGHTAFVEGWALYAERLGLEVGSDSASSPAPGGGGARESSSGRRGSGELSSTPDPSHGLYADPYQDFGRLNFEMWRAMRLVVDTGIHAKGWTRQRAIDYMTANSAISDHNIRAEVDRYIGWPGQATGYMIGRLAILDMRARAEEALGDDFDLRAFHDELLGAGALPLPVLEARMDRWINAQR